MATEEMAIIDGDVHFGPRDVGRPVLWFSTKSMNGGTLQVIEMSEIPTFLEEAGVRDIKELSGRAVVLSVDKGRVTFDRFL